MSYIPALDGIRAIAVLAVLVFHGNPNWLPGGFLGVDVFFVLSGFLITSILLREIETTGRIAFKRFYMRRARRLLPALLLVLLVSAVLVLFFAHDAAARLREDIVASLFYVTNWVNIFHGQSYFEATGRPPLLQHLWSLGVEEQFYVIWPTVALFAYRWRGRWGVRRVAMIGMGASTVLMAILSFWWNVPGGGDPSRLYFGSDTHAMTILAGATLATMWRPGRLRQHLPAGPTAALTAIGAAALGGIFLAFFFVQSDSQALYRGGFLIFAGLSVVLVAVATHPAIGAAKVLGLQPLRYLGQRSYGIYLWHWPIFMITRPGIDIGWTGVVAFIFQMTLTLCAAEMSYRYLEMPIRNGALSRTWKLWKSEGVAMKKAGLYGGVSAAVVIALGLGLAAIPPVDATTYLGGAKEVGTGALVVKPPEATKKSSTAGEGSAGLTDSTTAPAVVEAVPARPGEDLSKRKITAIGDSVLLGARVAVTKAMKKATVDASVGRQINDVDARIKERIAAGQLADVVVIHTGTNGPASSEELQKILDRLKGETRVVLVTTRDPLKWMDQSNSNIRTVAAKYPNVRVADWAAASAGQRAYFVADGTHLTGPGGRAYAQVIVNALRVP